MLFGRIIFRDLGLLGACMNIADSLKHILKNRGHVFSDFWKDDIKRILLEVSADLKNLYGESRSTINQVRKDGLKFNVQEMLDAGADSLLIMKIMPSRIKDGFQFFKEELSSELEALPDQKQKTIFTLKVIGALTSFTVSTIYTIKKGAPDFKIKGLKKTNAFTQFLIAEIIFRISHSLIQKFLKELESHVTDPDELKHIHYFQELLRERVKKDNPDHEEHQVNDRAIEIVENLKKYIMTGKQGFE